MKRVTFYQGSDGLVYAVRHQQPIEGDDAKAMAWLFGGAGGYGGGASQWLLCRPTCGDGESLMEHHCGGDYLQYGYWASVGY